MKSLHTNNIVLLTAVLLAAAGCATSPANDPREIPIDLRAPIGESIFLESLASGVQIYQCKATADKPSVFEWTFQAPEASLTNASGKLIGKHYTGPTWEFLDGSTVSGAAKARNPGPDTTAIPWLLLTATANTGDGVFSRVTSIQRVQTKGGVAPTEPCNSGNAGQTVRVPYTAAYYFYRPTRTGY